MKKGYSRKGRSVHRRRARKEVYRLLLTMERQERTQEDRVTSQQQVGDAVELGSFGSRSKAEIAASRIEMFASRQG